MSAGRLGLTSGAQPIFFQNSSDLIQKYEKLVCADLLRTEKKAIPTGTLGLTSSSEPSPFFRNSSDLIQQYGKLVYGY
jgi:hypothetical protein